MTISVDNYWNDINSIRLFPRELIGSKYGELIKHSETNNLSFSN